MSRHAGTQLTTCSNSLSNIVKPSSWSLEIRGWSWDNTSWQRRIGKSWLSSAMFSRYAIIPYHLIIDQPGFNRFSRTPPCSFHVIPPTSPLWYRQWITSTNTSRMPHSIPSTLCQSKLLSLLGRRPSTSTTTKQTILKSFALRWVQFLYYYAHVSH